MNYRNSITFILTIAILFIFSSCQKSKSPIPAKGKNGKATPMFKKLTSKESGIDFINQINEDETYNHILLDAVFNGGGVAVIDINNDGLQDLYFAGNMVEDKLYLNKGNMKFEDITQKSGIKKGTWSTGVTVADVNNDGYLDFYVGKFIIADPSKRRNHLYINNGDLTFSEKAAEYGIDDNGHCTAVNFFDYDKDGNMDLYVGNEPFVSRHAKYGNEAQTDKS